MIGSFLIGLVAGGALVALVWAVTDGIKHVPLERDLWPYDIETQEQLERVWATVDAAKDKGYWETHDRAKAIRKALGDD